MDTGDIFGEILEQGQNTAQNMQKSAQKGATQFGKTALGQITGSQSSTNPQSDQGSNEQATAQQKQMSDDQAKQFLKDLYGPSKPQSSDSQKGNPQQSSPQQHQNPIAAAIGMTPEDPNQGKKPEEVAKMQSLRSTLHQEYYQTLTNPQKPEEESVADKLEREDQAEKLEEVEKQKEKPDPFAAVKKGTGENMVGVSG